MNGRDVVRLVLLSAPRRPIVTKHAHRTSGVPLRVNCSCATRKLLRGPLLSVKNASPCADLELATHSVLKRRHGLARCRYHGEEGLRRWVGLGVIADNLINIGKRLVPAST